MTHHTCGSNLGGQHTGSMCASSYFINGGDGAHTTDLQFKSETDDSDMVWENSFTSKTWFLGTGRPTFDTSVCTHTSNDFHGSLYECDSALKVRPLQLYTPNRGTIVVRDTAPGHASGSVYLTKRANNIPKGTGMGLEFCPGGKNSANGYTMLVRDGANLEIYLPDDTDEPDYADQFQVFFSEEQWPEHLRSNITMRVHGPGAELYGLDGGPYVITNQHDRTFSTAYGCYVSNCGAWWEAKKKANNVAKWQGLSTFTTPAQYEAERVAWLASVGAY